MATPSAVIAIPPLLELEQQAESKRPPAAAVPNSSQAPESTAGSGSSALIINKTLASAANLAKLLPCSTVLVFEALSSSFTNRSDCYASNKFLTAALICLCAVSCLVFAFADSFVGRGGKHYYGLATPGGFFVFNRDEPAAGSGADKEGEAAAFENLAKRYRAKPLDYVHAFFSAAVFLTVAFSDFDVQGCFFPEKSANTKQLLQNLPLGMAILATLVFAAFPTTRKGIRAIPVH